MGELVKIPDEKDRAIAALILYVEQMVKIPGSEHAFLPGDEFTVKSWGEQLLEVYGHLDKSRDGRKDD